MEGAPATPAWTETPYDAAWAPFEDRFGFRAAYGVRDRPAVREPEGSLTLGLGAVFAASPPGFAAGAAAVGAAALRVFVDLLEGGEVLEGGGGAELLALDWQHPAYRYSPARLALSGEGWRVPVFPDGDYYVHTTADLRWGTLGHPWQQTLTLWGCDLVDTLGAELGTWLPVLRRDGRPVA